MLAFCFLLVHRPALNPYHQGLPSVFWQHHTQSLWNPYILWINTDILTHSQLLKPFTFTFVSKFTVHCSCQYIGYIRKVNYLIVQVMTVYYIHTCSHERKEYTQNTFHVFKNHFESGRELLRWRICLHHWWQWWFHRYLLISKSITWYILNTYSFLCVNWTSVKWFLKIALG